MRRYDTPVQVQRASEGPVQFRWRGRLYVVGEVLAQWIEVGAWWRERDPDGLPRPLRAAGRTVWRVSAQAGRSAPNGVYDSGVYDSGVYDSGVYDLVCEPSGWRLARVLD